MPEPTPIPVGGGVAAVVLNWKRADLTVECLASLAATPAPWRPQVCVVDNGSGDGSVAVIRAAHPEVEVIPLPRNLGFAAAVNKGLVRVLAGPIEWTLLINNDATVDPGALGHLVAAAGEASVGLLAPTIYRRDRPGDVWPAAGWRRGLTLAAFDTTAHPPGPEAYDVDWAAACCLLVRRGVWEDVGLLDEAFWFYYEDHDLCLRARAAGWRLLHVPRATAYHRVASSSGSGTPAQTYLLARSSVVFFARHTAGWRRVIIIPYRLGNLARVLFASLVRRRPRSGWGYLRGILAGLADLRAGAAAGAPVPRLRDRPVSTP